MQLSRYRIPTPGCGFLCQATGTLPPVNPEFPSVLSGQGDSHPLSRLVCSFCVVPDRFAHRLPPCCSSQSTLNLLIPSHKPTPRINDDDKAFYAENYTPHACRADSICHQAMGSSRRVRHPCQADCFCRQVRPRRLHLLKAITCTHYSCPFARHRQMLRIPGNTAERILMLCSYTGFFFIHYLTVMKSARCSVTFSPVPSTAIWSASRIVILPLTGFTLTAAVRLGSVWIKHPVPCASC